MNNLCLQIPKRMDFRGIKCYINDMKKIYNRKGYNYYGTITNSEFI